MPQEVAAPTRGKNGAPGLVSTVKGRSEDARGRGIVEQTRFLSDPERISGV
jgi:hypothetical protein